MSDILNGVFQDDAESRTTILETQKEEEGSDTTIRAVVEGDEEEGSSSGNRTTVTNVTNTTVTGVSGDDVKNTLTQPSGDGEQMRGDIVNRGDSATVEGGISSPGKIPRWQVSLGLIQEPARQRRVWWGVFVQVALGQTVFFRI